jgi:hypothetical protein
MTVDRISRSIAPGWQETDLVILPTHDSAAVGR